MKAILKTVFVLCFVALAACEEGSNGLPPIPGAGNESIGSKPTAIASQTLQGQMSGVSWTMTKAVGVIQPDGELQVSISGNGEVIDCNYTLPLKPGVLFTVPLKIADYDFDMLRPDVGYAVTWTYQDTKSQWQNTVSDMVKLSITSIGNDVVKGGLSAKFLDPSSPGKLNGTFEIKICR